MQWTEDDGAHAAALALLDSRNAARVAHPGGTLLAHLQRTAHRLESWGAAPPLVAAGLCHAAYGTQGFAGALFTLTERELLRARIGDEAEAIVYAYCAWDRAHSLPTRGELRDRFSGEHWVPAEHLRRQLAELIAANELDVAEHAALSQRELVEIGELLISCEPQLSLAAHAALRSAPFLRALRPAPANDADAARSDGEIAHRDLGQHGERVVFWHGGATPELTWARQHTLSAELRLRIPWRRGFAPSAASARQDWEQDARDLLRVMPGRVHVVGHSIGALSALVAAAWAPERFASLTLIEPPLSSVAADDPEVQQLVTLARAFVRGAPEARAAFLAIAALPLDHPQTARIERAARGLRDPSEAAPALAQLRDSRLPIAVVSGVHYRGIETMCDALSAELAAQRWRLPGAGHAVQRVPEFNVRLRELIAAVPLLS
jgi:pimeloyl-ACP methyl ester carboxylesterase